MQRAPGFAVPGFGTGWLPFMDGSGADDPQDGVPGGVRNFNQAPSTTTNNYVTNNYLTSGVSDDIIDDMPFSPPGGALNFNAAPSTGGGSLTTQQDGVTKSSTVTTLNIQGPAVISGASTTATLNTANNPAWVALCNGIF